MSVSQSTPQLQALLDVAVNPFGEKSSVAFLDSVEAATGLWNLHPKLQYIYQLARYEGVNPFGLAIGLYVRTASHVPPNVVLVDKDGRPRGGLRSGTSLNLSGVLVGRTGSNKTNLESVLDSELLPFTESVVGGTGQGLIKAYLSKNTKTKDQDGNPLPEPQDVVTWKRRGLTQSVDEFKFLREEFGRANSQTLSLLRTIVMGKKAGMENSDETRNATLPANLYRFTSLWYAQPVALDTLMAFFAEGDPQRFAYAPVKEYGHRALAARPATRPIYKKTSHPVMYAALDPATHPKLFGGVPMWDIFPVEEPYGKLAYPEPVWVHWCQSMHTEVPQMRRELDELIQEPYADYEGDEGEATYARELQAEVRSHLVLTTIKLAAAVTFYIGDTDPRDTSTDVHISEIGWAAAKAHMQVSTAELAGCFHHAKWDAARQRRAVARNHGEHLKVSKDTQDDLEQTALDKAALAVLRALARLRADNPDQFQPERTIHQQATGNHTSKSLKGALGMFKTTIVLDGSEFVPVELSGNCYRASDALMQVPAIQTYLDKWRPGWRAKVFTNSSASASDPSATFEAVVAGARA